MGTGNQFHPGDRSHTGKCFAAESQTGYRKQISCLSNFAGGCAWCSGANYEMYGTPNKRSTNICNAHKGRVLAICYYYNQRHLKLHDMPAKKMYLPYDETVEFVGKEEADYLFALEKEAFATK